MAWVRHDDRYDDTRKIKRAWRRNRATVGLHAMATTYCARHETDGLVDLDWLEDRLPRDREREEALKVMLDVGLLHELPAGETRVVEIRDHKITYGPLDEVAYIVKDYLDYNESSVEAAERRRRDAERKAEARARKSGKRPDGHRADSGDPVDGTLADVPLIPTRPDPTRPDLQPPQPPASGGRRRDHVRFASEMAAWRESAVASDAERERWRTALAAMPEHVAAKLVGLHAHASPNGRLLLGCGADSGGVAWTSERFGRFLDQAIDGNYELVDCGCPAADQAVSAIGGAS